MIEYLTGYSIADEIRIEKESKEAEEAAAMNIQDKPMSKIEAYLEDLEIMTGAKTFDKLWRFFQFIAGPPPKPHNVWSMEKCFVTNQQFSERLPL